MDLLLGLGTVAVALVIMIARPGGTMRPLWHVWVTWAFGPAGFVYCAVTNDGDPNCSLALIAVGGHGAALFLTLQMARSPARFRSLPEYWFMLTYWIPIAVVFLTLFLSVALYLGAAIDFPGERIIGRISMLAALGWVGLIPLAGLARLARAAWRPLCAIGRAR